MGDFSLDNVNDMYLDVLKEVGNIGAGNATTAIAKMLNVEIKMEVPQVRILEANKLSDAVCPEDEIVVGIFLEVTDDITGSMMFIVKMDEAHHLVDKLIGGLSSHSSEDSNSFNDMELSAMKEIGNIIAGSYLCALSNMTGLKMSPSVPHISVDMAGAILSVPAIMFGQYGDNALLIKTEFGDNDMIQGYFILMPEQDSYGKILESMGVIGQ